MAFVLVPPSIYDNEVLAPGATPYILPFCIHPVYQWGP